MIFQNKTTHFLSSITPFFSFFIFSHELYWRGFINNRIYLRANSTIHCLVGYFPKFNNILINKRPHWPSYHSSNNNFLEREKANFKHALAQPPCKHAKVQVRTILESVSVHARPYKARKIWLLFFKRKLNAWF